MKKIKRVSSTILILLLLFSSVFQVNAATTKVTLPTFDVTLNGVKIDNEYRKFPFIVYKGITYFPMTYHDSRFLGLETLWNNKIGLEVKGTENGNNYNYREPELLKAKNKASYTATIASFKIKVNGKVIDNTKEKYPLLLFREVTYFPMTWRFGVDEFGWEYNFTTEKGLIINSSTLSITEPFSPIEGSKTFQVGDSIVIVQLQRDGMPIPGNLSISIDGSESKPIGNEDYLYGYKGSISKTQQDLASNDYMELIDGCIYINAINSKEIGVSGIYKVNIETGETSKVE